MTVILWTMVVLAGVGVFAAPAAAFQISGKTF